MNACDLHRHVGEDVTTIGWLVTGKTVLTKDGDPMKFVSFEDTTGIYETVFFPKAYNQFCHMLNEMRPYLLKGKVEQDFTVVTLTVHWIGFLDQPDRGLRSGSKKSGQKALDSFRENRYSTCTIFRILPA